MDSPGWTLYLSIVVLLALSAFFSASETAISTFNKIRLKKRAGEGDARADKALALTEHYDRTLTSILIGNNIVNIAGSTIAAVVLTALLGPIGAAVSTLVMTLLVLIFAEILPKSYSKRHADQVALQIAGPLRIVVVLLRPLSAVFTRFTGGLVGEEEERTPTMTEEELHYFIESIEEEGVLEEQESNLVQSALEFDEITLREIITPRVNLVALDVESEPEEIRRVLLEDNHSRIPVYEGSIDNIIGILYAREAMCALIRGEEIDLKSTLREPYFAQRSMSLSRLLEGFQQRSVGMAVVLDEYGGTLGVVTMSDLLEELVGDLYDDEPDGLTPLGEDRYEVAGSCDLGDLLEVLGYDEDELDSEYTTANGWAMHSFGHIPEAGESFRFEGWRFEVLEMDGHRIGKLLAEPAPPEPLEDGSESGDE